MNMKEMKMYEAPKMEIVEVELESQLMVESNTTGGTTVDGNKGGDLWGGEEEGGE